MPPQLRSSHISGVSRVGRKGRIGNAPPRGSICHYALAVEEAVGKAAAKRDSGEKDSGEDDSEDDEPPRSAAGRVLGLADQRLHVNPLTDKKAESRKECRERTSRQSRLWVASCEAIGPTPEGCRWIEVCGGC